MAKQDMRIDVDFVDHPKTKRLIRMTGYEGFYCLMKLFSIAAKIYKRGELKNCDAVDIEDLTGWTGEQGKLVEAMLDTKIGFLEKKGNLYIIHDWDINQPWIYHSEERSEKAKKSVSARWEKNKSNTINNSNVNDSDAYRIKNVYETYQDSNTPSPSPIPIPIPSPIPSPSLRNPLTPLAGGNGPAKKQKQYITDTEASVIINNSTTGDYASMLKTFVKNRRDIKKPMTRLALEQTLNILSTKLDTDQERIDCIQLSIANGWTGIFPERSKKIGGRSDQPSQSVLGNEDRWEQRRRQKEAARV